MQWLQVGSVAVPFSDVGPSITRYRRHTLSSNTRIYGYTPCIEFPCQAEMTFPVRCWLNFYGNREACILRKVNGELGNRSERERPWRHQADTLLRKCMYAYRIHSKYKFTAFSSFAPTTSITYDQDIDQYAVLSGASYAHMLRYLNLVYRVLFLATPWVKRYTAQPYQATSVRIMENWIYFKNNTSQRSSSAASKFHEQSIRLTQRHIRCRFRHHSLATCVFKGCCQPCKKCPLISYPRIYVY